MATQTQIEITGKFTGLWNEFKKLAGIIDGTMGNAVKQVDSLNQALSQVAKGGGRARNTIASLGQEAAKLAQSAKPLNQVQYTEALYRFQAKGGGAAKEAGQQLGQTIREAQQQAIRNQLSQTAKGINDGLKLMLETLRQQKVEITDSEGNTVIKNIGSDVKQAVRVLRKSIADAVKTSTDFIKAEPIQQWGKEEFGADWSVGEVDKIIRDANEKINRRITNGLRRSVDEAVASGQKVSASLIAEIDSGIASLKQGAQDTMSGEPLKARIREIDALSTELRGRLDAYDKNLDKQLQLDSLEKKARGLLDAVKQTGFSAIKPAEFKGLLGEREKLGGAFKTLFGDLQVAVNNAFRKQTDTVVNNILLRGKAAYDKNFLQAARDAGASDTAISEINSRMWRALLAYRRSQRDAVRQQLEADGKEIERALRDAGEKAFSGIAPSSKLETLINNYKGKDVGTYLQALQDTRLRALEARIQQALNSTGKLAAGIEEAFKIDAARANIRLDEGDLPRLFKELANRKQQELQTAIDVFNERYAAALFDIKQPLISGKPVNLAGFEAKWSREASKVNAVFNKQSIGDVVAEAAAERNARDLQAAADKVLREQQSLVDRVRKAISTAGYKGTNVSVSTATPLFAELQSAITSAANNTGSLVVAVSQLRQNVFKGLSAEIKQLERDALAAGSVIKQSDIASIQGKITAAAPNLLSHEVARLNATLSNTVKTVDTAVRQASIDAVRTSLSSAAGNLQFTSKELLNQIKSASAELRNLGVTRQERLNVGEFSKASFSLNRALQREAQLAQNDLRKQALGVIQNLSRTAELSAQVIGDARKQFVAAGGNAADIARMGISGVSNNLNAKVAELIRTGSELPQDFVRFYNNLYQAAGATGTQLQSLMGTVKSLASTVNMNAAQAAKARVEDQIRRVFAEANALGRVISEHIYKGLESQAFAAGIDFKATFNADIIRQDEIRAQNALRQHAEGIIKPYEQMLRELTTLGAIQGGAGGVEAQLQYRAKIAAEGFLKSIRDGLNKSIANLELLRAEKVIDNSTADAEIANLRQTASKIIADSEAAVVSNLTRRLNKIASQLKTASLGNDIGAVSKLSSELDKVRAQIDGAGLGGAKIASSAQKLAGKVAAVEQDVAKRIENNAALEKARALLRSHTMKLGGANALQMQIDAMWTEVRAAMAVAFKNADKALAKKLLDTGKQLEAQIRDQFAMRSAGKGSGSQNMIGGVPAGIYQNFLRQLPMQITDIVVGLSTGQRPMYVLLQQGGQLKDMFGGIGNAVKEVGKYMLGLLTPMNLAIAAVAGLSVGFGALVNRAGNLEKEARRANVVLKGMAGRSFDFETVRQYGKELSEVYGIMESRGRQAFMSLAQNARLPEKLLDPIVEGARDIQAFLGKGFDASGLEDTLKTLSEAFSIDKHRNNMMQLKALFQDMRWDDGTATEIERLFAQEKKLKDVNKQVEIKARLFEILRERARGAADEGLTPFEQAARNAKKELIKAWNVIAEDSAWNTFFENIAKAGVAVMEFAQSALRNFKAIWYALKDTWAHIKNGPTGSFFGGLKDVGKGFVQTLGSFVAPSVFSPDGKRETGIITGGGLSAQGLAKIWKGVTFQVTPEQRAKLKQELDKNIEDYFASTNITAPAAKKATGRLLNLGDGGGKKGGGKSQMEKDADAAEKYILKLKEAWENYRQLTKLEQLSFDLEHGKVKMTAEQIAVATELAKKIDERTRKQAEELRIMERKRMEAQKMVEVQNKIQEYAIQAARMSNADSVVDYYQQMLEYDNQLMQRIRDLNYARDKEVRDYYLGGKSNQIADLNAYYDYQINLERQKAEELKKIWDEYYRYQIELGTDWLVGFEKGLNQVAFKVKDLSSEVASAVESWADQMGDALATFVRTGKFDFKSLVNSILDDIARIAANNLIRNLVGGFKFGFGTPIADSGHQGVQSALGKFKSLGEVQRVWVENMPNGLSNIGSMFSSTFSKDSFSLGSFTSMFGSSSKPLISFSSATQIGQQVANRAADEIVPVVNSGARSMFSTLTDGLGDTFSKIFSGLGSIFSSSSVSSTGGSGGGFWSSLFSIIGSIFTGSGHYKGGYTGPGGKYTPAGIVHAGEFVINAASTRKLGLDFLNRLNGYADGGYVSQRPSIVNSPMMKDGGAGLEVNIYNNGNNDVRAQRNSSGGLDIFIEQAVNAVAGSIGTGGAVAAAMQRAYGLNRGVGTPRTGY